jgi:integrase/recombinase XerD
MDTLPAPVPDAALAVAPAAATDAALVQLWLHGRPASTVKVYLAALDAFTLGTGGKPLRRVTLADLQAHADTLAGLKPATRAKRLAGLKSLFGFATKLGYLPLDPARALRLPRRPADLAERILPPEAVARVVAAEPDPRRRLMLRLFYVTGGRISEVVAVRWEDCHPHNDGGVVTFAHGKGGKSRTVRVPAPVWAELAALRPEGGSGCVFPSARRQDRPINSATAWRWFTAAAARAGVMASPHWFRHAHASHALDGGAPVHVVMKTLGHASMSTTSQYAHARPWESSGDYLDLGSRKPARARRARPARTST